MALLTAQGISRVLVALFNRALVLPSTVTQVPGAEFAGSNGDTITLRVPQPSAARTQATPGAAITYDETDEVAVDVSLAHLYNAKRITDEELSLDLEDFARQVSRVQIASVAIGAEDELATAMNDLVVDQTIEFATVATEDDTIATILAAREFLSTQDAPPGDRWAAVSSQIATRILSLKNLLRANEAGSDQALRRAVIGDLLGFTFVESPALADGTANFYHRSGFAFANRAPVRPRGAVDSASVSAEGLALRQIFQYDPDILSDASVVSTFAGAAAVSDGVAAITAIGTNDVITTATPHRLKVGDRVVIAGSNATPTGNGSQTVATVPSTTTFTIAGVDFTVAGTAGTATARRRYLKVGTA